MKKSLGLKKVMNTENEDLGELQVLVHTIVRLEKNNINDEKRVLDWEMKQKKK